MGVAWCPSAHQFEARIWTRYGVACGSVICAGGLLGVSMLCSCGNVPVIMASHGRPFCCCWATCVCSPGFHNAAQPAINDLYLSFTQDLLSA